MVAFVFRTYYESKTLGDMLVFDDKHQLSYSCKTLELPWRNNKKRASCIPEGVYEVTKRFSPKFKNHFHILDVPNRSYILIHQANFVSELLGCIAVGASHADINGDGINDVTQSVKTMNELSATLPDVFKIVITSKN